MNVWALAISLALIACEKKADAPPPAPATTAATVAAPTSATPAACAVAGDWTGTGDDSNKTQWTIKMRVTQSGSALDGVFDWTGSNGHRGNETFKGTIDCATRSFTLRGESVSPGAPIITGTYQGVFGPDFKTLDGIWKNGAPGSFKMTRP